MFKVSKRLIARQPIIEDDFHVTKFRRYLPASEDRPKALIQFYAKEGGLRTVAEGDLVEIR